MSVFNLKLEYPALSPKWYKTNSDGVTPKCPAEWQLNELSEFNRYVERQDGFWTLQINYGESVVIPFQTNDIEKLNTKEFTFNHFAFDPDGDVNYIIRVSYNETDYEDLYYVTIGEHTDTLILPDNVEYIKMELLIQNDLFVLIYTDIEFDIHTDNYDINTEQNEVSIAPNIVSAVTLDNRVQARKLSKTDVNYLSKIILKTDDELDIDSICDLARLNEVLLSVNINVVEQAGNSLANLPSGAAENWIKYYYNSHQRVENTGLYRYIDMNYRKDVNSNAIYF